MGRLANKTILITGATSGFGQAIALAAAAEGARLLLTGRRKERLTALQRKLDGHDALCLPLDVRDKAAVFALIENLPAPFADIDILVNNAGLALGLEKAPEADLQNWETMVETNINGVLYCTRAVLPGMAARNRGHIVMIGSIAGNYAYPGGNAYGASKAFVHQFCTNLRADLLGTPLRVTSIEPGMAETEFSLVRFNGDAAGAAAVYRGITPLNAADIADAVLWAVTRPPHVNINRVEIMPTAQAPGGPIVVRKSS